MSSPLDNVDEELNNDILLDGSTANGQLQLMPRRQDVSPFPGLGEQQVNAALLCTDLPENDILGALSTLWSGPRCNIREIGRFYINDSVNIERYQWNTSVEAGVHVEDEGSAALRHDHFVYEDHAPLSHFPRTRSSSSSAGFRSDTDHNPSGNGNCFMYGDTHSTRTSSSSSGAGLNSVTVEIGEGWTEADYDWLHDPLQDLSSSSSGAVPNSNTVEIGARWTKADDELLHNLVQALPRTASGRIERGAFKNIVTRFSGRTYEQLHQRYYLLKHRTSPWTSEYDTKLSEAVKNHGPNFQEIRDRYFPDRQARELKMRYENYINPELKQGSLSQDEEEQIFRYEFGMSHFITRSELARSMKRSENCCKNFWEVVKKAVSTDKALTAFENTWRSWLRSPKRDNWIERATTKFERNRLLAARETSSSVMSEATIPDPEPAFSPLPTTVTPPRCVSAPFLEAITSATPKRPDSAPSFRLKARKNLSSDASMEATPAVLKRPASEPSRGAKAIKLGPDSSLPEPSSSSSASGFHSVVPRQKGT